VKSLVAYQIESARKTSSNSRRKTSKRLQEKVKIGVSGIIFRVLLVSVAFIQTAVKERSSDHNVVEKQKDDLAWVQTTRE